MNPTTEPLAEYEAEVATYELYLYWGIAVFIINVVVITTFLSSSTLYTKYQLLIALAFSDLIAGLGNISGGYFRLRMYANYPNLPNNTAVVECIKVNWIPMQTIGAQWPATISFVIGFERVLAVFKPLEYKAHFTDKHKLLLILFSFLFVLIGMIAGYVEAVVTIGNEIIDFVCSGSQVYSPTYLDFHRLVIISGHSLGFCQTAAAYRAARKLSSMTGAKGAEMRDEVKRINVLLAISGFSVVLVSLPTLVLWGANLGIYVLPFSVINYVTLIFNFNSSMSLLVPLLLKKEFRNRLIYLLSCSFAGKNDITTGAVVHVQSRSIRTGSEVHK